MPDEHAYENEIMGRDDRVSDVKRMEKRELPIDSVTISPMTVAVEAGNWQASSLFEVQNNTDEVLYQVLVKLKVDHPHIRIQDFVIESPNPAGEPDKDVEQIKIRRDFVTLAGNGSEGKKTKYLVIGRLNSSEIWQFIITKCSPYVPSKQYILHATVLSFSKESTSTQPV